MSATLCVRQSNLIGWQCYVGDAVGTDQVSPYAAPTRTEDLTGLPPAYLPVGDEAAGADD